MTIQKVTTEFALPTPPEIPGYTWRPARREDVPAIHAMLIAVDKADDRTAAGTLEDRQREFDDPWSNPEADSLLAFAPDGTVAALARTFVNPKPEGESRAYLWDEVHPEHRRVGDLGEFLLSWLEARGRQRLQATPGDLPRVLRVGCQDNLHDRMALYERRGFRAARYFYKMRRDLGQPIPDMPLAEGLTLRTYSPEMDHGTLEAFNESFSDHWGFERATQEDWQMFFVGRSSFRPEVTFLTLEGDRVIGFSVNYISPEDNARHGIQEGWIGSLGVRRAWRKRGVASALLCQSMRAFKAEGLDYATLGVDTENLTGALRLYERVGFAPVKRFIAFAKPVS